MLLDDFDIEKTLKQKQNKTVDTSNISNGLNVFFKYVLTPEE